MLQEKKSKRGAWIALGCVAALLVLVIVLENTMQPTSMLFTVLKKGAVYALVAASLNLLNGFTGLFSLGQAGFMLLGAYTYAILTIPSADRESVYYLYGGSAVNFSLPELFGGGALGLILGVLAALILAGCVAAVIAWLIGLPVLRLKSDYLAIATLGFAEIIRAIFQWDRLGPVTNGANALKSFPTFSSFNIENANGEVVLRLSTFVPFLLVAVCIGIMVLLINSTYGRAFKAIREDEVAAEAMGINLAKHKRMAFCISSFFAGVGGGLFAMFANQAQAKTFTTSMTYEILLIVVIGGIGSISGSWVYSSRNGTPIMRECVAEHFSFAEPMPVPVPDSYFIQVITGLESVESFYYWHLAFYLIQIFVVFRYQIELCQKLNGWSDNTLFIIDLMGRIIQSVFDKDIAGFHEITQKFLIFFRHIGFF